MYGIKYVYSKRAIRTTRQYDSEKSPLYLVIYGLFFEALFLFACLKIAYLCPPQVILFNKKYRRVVMVQGLHNDSISINMVMSKTINSEGKREKVTVLFYLFFWKIHGNFCSPFSSEKVSFTSQFSRCVWVQWLDHFQLFPFLLCIMTLSEKKSNY